MKKIFALGTAAAVLSMTAIAASAAIAPEFTAEAVAGQTVTVDVIANGVTTDATQFTVATTGLTYVSYESVPGGLFGDTTMTYAWAGTEAPADGTVLLTLTFTVDAAADEDVSVALVPAEGMADVAADAVVSTVVDGAAADVTDETVVDTAETVVDETVVETVDTAETDSTLVEDTAETVVDTAESAESADAGEGTDGKGNPETGIALAVVPAVIAGAAIVVAKKRK